MTKYTRSGNGCTSSAKKEETMYGKPVEDEIQRIKRGNKRDGEYMLSAEELN